MDPLHIDLVPITPAVSIYKTALSTPTPTTPPLSTDASIDPERTSSETTIVTIYSMYEDEGVGWAFPSSVDHANFTLDANQKYRHSFLRASQHTIEDSAYYDSTYDPPHLGVQSSAIDVTKYNNDTAYLAYQDDRRSNHLSGKNVAPCHSSREQHISLNSSTLGSLRPLPTPPSGSRASSRNSSHPRSFGSPHEASSSRPQSRLHSLHVSAAPFASSPRISPVSISPSSFEAPLEGEDPDAFHVRRTYAELELVGVKGDGYIEGVERTRAKVGTNRESELRALEALGNESEKKRDLSAREIEMLASLDRYGFFTTPSHDRLMLLHSRPLNRPLSRPPQVVTNAEATLLPLASSTPLPAPEREILRALKWRRMLEVRALDGGKNVAVWGVKASKEAKLRERTFKGIPDCWRSAVWEMMMNRATKTSERELDKLSDEFQNALNKPSTYDVQIDLDVPRTISGHVMFRTRYGQGQRSLFHVLHAFSLRCNDCGYCQGMGPVAATLLSYMDPVRVYVSLVRLHDAFSMHSILSPGFPGLLEAIFVQERIMQHMMPAVYNAFKQHAVSTTSYATKWYITLFANSVPFHTQLRLWDVFFLEGPDLFVIMAVAIVWTYKNQITSSSANFETILSLLSSFFVPEDDEALLCWIGTVMGDQKIRTNIRRWRAEWKELVASGQDGQALL